MLKANVIEYVGAIKLLPLVGLASQVSLAFVFTYTAFSKVYDWKGTKEGMYNQVFPDWMAEVLLWDLPV